MRSSAGIGERESYASELEGLWSGLSHTLTRLEALAADPARLGDEATLNALPRLRYVLHAAGETALGIDVPAEAQPAHADLAAALAEARDLTAEIEDVLAREGAETAGAMVYEWRGALFRVRLARLRLAVPAQSLGPPPDSHERPFPLAALVATMLLLAGTAAFVLGAATASWPVWTAGLLAFATGCVAYRSPKP